MQRTEYVCDWCHKPTDPQHAHQLNVAPVVVVEFAGAADPDPINRAEKNVAGMAERQKRRLSADICDSCLLMFREWIAERKPQ
jgi:hypothetical protein